MCKQLVGKIVISYFQKSIQLNELDEKYIYIKLLKDFNQR